MPSTNARQAQQEHQQQQYSSASASVSPPRRSFGAAISAVGAKLNRALSSDRNYDGDADGASIASSVTAVEGGNGRSRSRGRHSSGRGGAGNFYPATAAEPIPPLPTVATPPTQEFPWPRGRERAPVVRGGASSSGSVSPPAFSPPRAASQQQQPPQVRSTGRGGAGNFSRSPPTAVPEPTLAYVGTRVGPADGSVIRSSGRGGIGNIVTPDSFPASQRSARAPSGGRPDANGFARSRSRSVDPVGAPAGYAPGPRGN